MSKASKKLMDAIINIEEIGDEYIPEIKGLSIANKNMIRELLEVEIGKLWEIYSLFGAKEKEIAKKLYG